MSFFQWSDDLNTGSEEIDFQHKRLFDMANELAENMEPGISARMFQEILLEQLLQYTDYHFRIEENLMQEKNYPDFKAHKALHDKLRSQVLDFQSKFKRGDVEISEGLMTFLKNWLFDHIQKVDTKLAKVI